MKRKLRVAVLTFEHNPIAAGGLGRIVRDLCSRLGECDITPVVFIPASGYPSPWPAIGSLKTPCDRYQALHCKDSCGEYVVLSGGALLDGPGIYPDPNDFAETCKSADFGLLASYFFAALQIDLVHLQDFHGYHAIPTARALGLPVVHTVHMIHEGDPNIVFAEQMATSQADVVTAVSQSFIDDNPTFFARTRRSLAIANGYDASFWNQQQVDRAAARRDLFKKLGFADQPCFAYVGRINNYHKGVAHLMRVAESICEGVANINFIFVGEGNDRLEADLSAVAKRFPSQICFLNRFASPEEVRQVFASTDFAVFPSLFEPFGLVQLEAAAVGTVPLVSRVGGLHEISRCLFGDDSDRLTFAKGDESSLKMSILHAHAHLTSPEGERKGLLGSIHATVRDFSVDKVAKKYAALYQNLVASHPRHP